MSADQPQKGQVELFLAYGADVDPRDYQVLAEDRASLPWAEVRLHVIGESSLVIVERPGLRLAEVVTCGGSGIACALARGGFRADAVGSSSLAASTEAFQYRACLWSTPVGHEPFSSPLGQVLEHVFPGPHQPLTRIEIGPLSGGLLLRTRHDYPEFNLHLWSESAWSFAVP